MHIADPILSVPQNHTQICTNYNFPITKKDILHSFNSFVTNFMNLKDMISI